MSASAIARASARAKARARARARAREKVKEKARATESSIRKIVNCMTSQRIGKQKSRERQRGRCDVHLRT